MNDPKDNHARIAARAYQLWEAEGRPQGRDQDHWRRAEAEVAATRANATPTVTAKPVAPPPAPVKKPTLFRGRKPTAPAQPTR